ncbi:MAG: AI-2E family transporter [Magnetococcales bacterium]|nr:AI-2E family transporter [Magnetococcales bacterium]
MSPFFDGLSNRLNDPHIRGLIFVLIFGVGLFYFFGAALAPYFAAIIIAYLMEGQIRFLERLKLPRIIAVLIVFAMFFLLINLFLFKLLPTLVAEVARVSGEIPRITQTLKNLTYQLSNTISGYVDAEFAEGILVGLVEMSQEYAADALTMVVQGGLPGLISVVVYLLLVPFLVFFFMKDKDLLLNSFSRFMPQERGLINKVLHEVNIAVGGYIRGKFLEMLLLGSASYLGFAYIGFEYAFLIGILTGLSVLIPFLGLAVVTIPVLVLGVFQWGLSWEALNPLAVYAILQMVDGNAVAPIILGETVKVHPTTIMLAVLFFGSLWGVIGVFFAVPLWVLVKSVLEAVLFSENPNSTEITESS